MKPEYTINLLPYDKELTELDEGDREYEDLLCEKSFEFSGNETTLTIEDTSIRAVFRTMNLLDGNSEEWVGDPGVQGEVREGRMDQAVFAQTSEGD